MPDANKRKKHQNEVTNCDYTGLRLEVFPTN